MKPLDDLASPEAYLAFVRAQAPSARRPAVPPAALSSWDRRLETVRAGLMKSFGRAPDSPCDLDPEVLGTLDRDGYVIERLTFQSRPGVRVTANLYRPEPVRDQIPAVLSVHGHWPWARIDPHVQARCIGLARRGYACLAVDAFGAGERAIEPGPGTYHGALVGAQLWPAGVPLLGLQVYDNRRAVDYLLTRSEVDPARLAITGASGGGNQTLYAGATDDRLAAVVPVCGVGTFESYLGAACCVCEVLVGGLTYATTGDVLALVAPRALMVVNATRDAVQFSVAEAAKSVAYASERFRLLGVPEKLRHVAIESGHDYNQPMREALYGWLDRWMREEGDGSPVAEPNLVLEDPQALRCYPDGGARPATIVTIPAFAVSEGKARLAALPPAPDHASRWEADAVRMRAALGEILGRFPARSDLRLVERDRNGKVTVEITPEPGLRLKATRKAGKAKGHGVVVILHPQGQDHVEPELIHAVGEGADALLVDLRASGRQKPQTAAIQGVPDHTEAEWGLWIGRPLLGQWVWDTMRWLDALDDSQIVFDGRKGVKVSRRPYRLVGVGPMGVVALAAAALDPRIDAVALVKAPITLVSPDSWKGIPMGILAPNLFDAGDIGHLAALMAPRRLVLAAGVEPTGSTAPVSRIEEAWSLTRSVYSTLKAPERLTILPTVDWPTIVARWIG